MSILEQVQKATPDEVNDILMDLVKRYDQIFPGWQLHILTIEKAVDKNEQIDAAIALLEKLKEG